MDYIALMTREGTGIDERINFAAIKAAVDVMSEDPGTTNHTNRIIWAKRVLYGSYNLGPFYLAVVSQSAFISATNFEEITDATVQTAVNSLIDHFANIYSSL